MATDTFTWPVRGSSSEDLKVSTNQAQFGDGYKQISSMGINTADETWALTCNGSAGNMRTVRDFLREHVISSFWWVNPWGEEKLYRVKSDSINSKFVNGGFVEISFTFEQAFAP